MNQKALFLFIPLLIAIGVFMHKPTATYLFGEARWDYPTLDQGNLTVPRQRTIAWKSNSKLAEDFIKQNGFKDVNLIWDVKKKEGNVRSLLWHLMAEEKIPEINSIIKQMSPWGTSGSAWLLNPKGGYNFATTPLITILFLFEDRPDILYPETRKHIAEVLINEEGGGFTDAVPKLMGRVKDSENHVLMAQSTKYLKNLYMVKQGNTDPKYNNYINGMEEGILNLLSELNTIGFYEFNSMPYSAYSITPLLNLEAFGSNEVRAVAREVLDYLSFSYALGSYNFRHYAPFRRRLDRHKVKSLTTDYQTAFMKAWMAFHPDNDSILHISKGPKHALIGMALPYRPPDKVVDLLFNKSPGYYVRLGHGTKSCPEIYSAGEGYLLSAGGANQGKWSIIVARPTCLFLDDGAQRLEDVIHLNGKGSHFMEWNNTGVYKNFACTNGPVHIPDHIKPVYGNNNWSIFHIADENYVAVHSGNDFGLLAVLQTKNPQNLCTILHQNNPEKDKLRSQFQFPGGDLIRYAPDAPRHLWVIQEVNGKVLNRNFKKWPLIQGEFYKPKTKS